MATAPPDRSPFDDVRDAFAGLGTAEKAAFVFEATFDTIGQALAETGRRAATVLDDLDIDDWFRMDVEVEIDAEDVGEAPPAAAPPPAAPPPRSTKKAPGKTAGKAAPKRSPRKKKDDDA